MADGPNVYWNKKAAQCQNKKGLKINGQSVGGRFVPREQCETAGVMPVPRGQRVKHTETWYDPKVQRCYDPRAGFTPCPPGQLKQQQEADIARRKAAGQKIGPGGTWVPYKSEGREARAPKSKPAKASVAQRPGVAIGEPIALMCLTVSGVGSEAAAREKVKDKLLPKWFPLGMPQGTKWGVKNVKGIYRVCFTPPLRALAVKPDGPVKTVQFIQMSGEAGPDVSVAYRAKDDVIKIRTQPVAMKEAPQVAAAEAAGTEVAETPQAAQQIEASEVHGSMTQAEATRAQQEEMVETEFGPQPTTWFGRAAQILTGT